MPTPVTKPTLSPELATAVTSITEGAIDACRNPERHYDNLDPADAAKLKKGEGVVAVTDEDTGLKLAMPCDVPLHNTPQQLEHRVRRDVAMAVSGLKKDASHPQADEAVAAVVHDPTGMDVTVPASAVGARPARPRGNAIRT